jgi:hypothetical protein
VRRGVELLEAGRAEDALRELRGVAAPRAAAAAALRAPAAPLEPWSDGELDLALENAAPEVEHMLHADDVAQAAIRQAERELPPEEAALAADHPRAPFATATMAELLERQGDRQGASRIRASLRAPAAPPAPPAPAARGAVTPAAPALRGAATPAAPAAGGSVRRRRVIDTLEGWLGNLRSRPRDRRGASQ